MDYVSFKEVLFSVVCSAAFGFAASFFYILLQTFIYTFERFIFLPKRIFISSSSVVALKNARLTDVSVASFGKNIKLFIADFIYVLLYGLSSIFLLYVTCDGVLRLYPLILSGAVNIFSIKFFGKRLQRLIERVISFVYLCITVLISAIILIIRKSVFGVVKVFHPLCCLVRNLIWVKNSKKSKKI
jgi:hypothetical protein